LGPVYYCFYYGALLLAVAFTFNSTTVTSHRYDQLTTLADHERRLPLLPGAKR